MKYISINKDDNLKKALKFISKNGLKCVLITDENKKFLGTLSDGDIRNALISNHTLTEKVNNFYNKRSKFVHQNKYNHNHIRSLLIKFSYSVIPVINDKKDIVDVITWENFFNKKNKIKNIKIPAIIMAGGRGNRLKPFTNILPKPLMPINDQTMLDIIVKDLRSYGINNIFLTLSYKFEIIKSYLKEMKYGKKISCIYERQPMGTAGGLRLILNKVPTNTVLVTNCDITAKLNYTKLIEYHKKNNNSLTIVTSFKEYILPYGVYRKDKLGNFDQIDEKPKYNFLINIGIYLINKECIKLIPKNKKFDMTDLIKKAKSKNLKIGTYTLNDSDWQDIGEWDQFSKTLKNINK